MPVWGIQNDYRSSCVHSHFTCKDQSVHDLRRKRVKDCLTETIRDYDWLSPEASNKMSDAYASCSLFKLFGCAKSIELRGSAVRYEPNKPVYRLNIGEGVAR